MANQIVRLDLSEDELLHYGVLGMKWGVRRANYKTRALTKKVYKTVKKFDRGKDPDVTRISKEVRRQKFKVDRSVKRAERFIAKSNKASSKDIINRYNKDPAKKAAVENYMKELKMHTVPLAELRLQLIDIRV
jgi:hypothetical protein